jgi:hypothetical protein
MARVTDAQVRKLMEEFNKDGRVGHAAMKAGMDRKTARKYIAAGTLPSEMHTIRDWRTRKNPFEEDWAVVAKMLEASPALEAKTIFEELLRKQPGRYQEGQLRTLQRQIRQWRALRGPEQDVKLAQLHRPGEAAQTDFTRTGELAITIAGERFVHLLCILVLPYSNWRWATVCLSESCASLRRGVQRALFQLGRVPQFHQTDNSTGATHKISEKDKEALPGKTRVFNKDYLALTDHFGMTPRTTGIGEKEQNGDVEAANGVTKRGLEQSLLLRGSRDFDSIDAWQEFVDAYQRKANSRRTKRLKEEMVAMRELPTSKLPEFVELHVPVSEWSTIRIKSNAYSVPSRLIRREVHVRVFESKIEVYYGSVLQLRCERVVGRRNRIDYRHIIWSLVRKPAGFARYVYREEMFPSPVFRQAYDVLAGYEVSTKTDLEYLRILHLAASTMQETVEIALEALLAADERLSADAVKAIACFSEPTTVPDIAVLDVDLASYDQLIGEVA